LEQKAAVGCSFSLVDRLRWDFRAIFRLAAQDRLLPSIRRLKVNTAAERFKEPSTRENAQQLRSGGPSQINARRRLLEILDLLQ
jgi:hypothetical protein